MLDEDATRMLASFTPSQHVKMVWRIADMTATSHVPGVWRMTLQTYTVSQKKRGHFYFYCNFVKCWPILIIFCMLTRNHLRIRYEQYFPPHLNFVAALPCKTNTSMNMNVTTASFSSAIKYLNKS